MDTSTTPTPLAAFPEALLGMKFAQAGKSAAATRSGTAVIVGSNRETLRRFARFLRFFDHLHETVFCREIAGEKIRIADGELQDVLRALLLLSDRRAGTVLLPVDLLNAELISRENFRTGTVVLRPGDELEISDLVETLVSIGYERVPIVRASGTFAVRGSLVDVFAPQDDRPLRLDFDDVRLSNIRAFDPQTQESLKGHAGKEYIGSEIRIPPCVGFEPSPSNRSTLREWLDGCRLYHMEDEMGVEDLPGAALSLYPTEESGPGVDRLEEPVMPLGIESQVEEIRKLADQGWKIALGMPADLCRRLGAFYQDKKIPFQHLPPGSFPDKLSAGLCFIEGDLPGGLRDASRKILLLSASDLFPRRRGVEGSNPAAAAATAPAREYATKSITDVLELSEGDYVVHEQYGIGVFRGLKRIKTREEEGEYLAVEYRDKDILYVPLDKFHMVQKYVGSGRKPKPHRLGEAAWQKTKQNAKKKIVEFARDLLGLYATREHHQGFAFSADNVFQHEFEMRFHYEETPDQTRAIADVKKDMEALKPMDRVVCGDAGFGKTEVALRAAFKAAMDNKQVALVVPTTLLAEQHRQVFEERFANLSVKIAGLSRFKTKAEQQDIIRRLKSGEIDICVGTHRLLQDDVLFNDLGLLIIDEEHRFGVRQKERLKFYRQFVDVLSMSATPIPRTLYMSLVGARDISIIETPPKRRIPIQTEIYPYHPKLIREATLREMERGGQVFFLYNRVESIEKAADWIRRAAPEAKIGIAHGQMSEEELENVMTDFYHKRLDVLVTTTIIESGLDLPNANTLFIFDAERFGLATLYQLRGRVGRSDRPAYCYLLTPEGAKPLTVRSRRRLEAIAAITGVGGGYRVALEDLTLRGAGNLLGPEQHGIVWEIGFEMYCDMLKNALVELKGAQEEPPWNVRVDIKIPQFIPGDLLPDAGERIALYRRIAKCRTGTDLKVMENLLRDRFGEPPPSLQNLLRVRQLKFLAEEYEITEVIEWNKSLSVYTDSPRVVLHLTSKLRPTQLTPRQIEYNLRGMTADVFLQKFVNMLTEI